MQASSMIIKNVFNWQSLVSFSINCLLRPDSNSGCQNIGLTIGPPLGRWLLNKFFIFPEGKHHYSLSRHRRHFSLVTRSIHYAHVDHWNDAQRVS